MSTVQQRAPGVGEKSFVTPKTAHFRVSAPVMIALALAGTLLACSEQKPSPLAPLAPRAFSQTTKAISPTPATVGWQVHARALVGANSMNPLGAGRVYAALA